MTDTSVSSTPEEAVRAYLTYLEDPSKMVDAAEVKKLQKAVDTAKDPVDKLRAIAAVEKASAADPAMYRDGFIQHAKKWADTEGVPASVFKQLGVEDDVLAAAGLAEGKRRRGRQSRKAKADAAPRTRRPSMRPEQLQEGILALDGSFSVKDVTERVGGSTVAVTAALERLKELGKITPAGERSGGRGRAAKVWTRTTGFVGPEDL
jgi:hypothetical protein